MLLLSTSPEVSFFRTVFVTAGIFFTGSSGNWTVFLAIFFTGFSGNWTVFLVFVAVFAWVIDLVDCEWFDKVFACVLSVNLVPKNFLKSVFNMELLA